MPEGGPETAALRAPPGLHLLAEVRALAELRRFRREQADLVRSLPRGAARDILVLPGFLASDRSTAPLRQSLSAIGHHVQGWGLGRNLGLRTGRFEAMEAAFLTAADRAAGPLVLIGWSLGGLYAVALAARHAARVAHVFTLGSPVSGNLTANHAWRGYQRIAGHPISAPPVDWRPGVLPPVPFTAVQALGDGVIHPLATRAPDGPMAENVAVHGSHVGLAWNAQVVRLIAERLIAQ